MGQLLEQGRSEGFAEWGWSLLACPKPGVPAHPMGSAHVQKCRQLLIPLLRCPLLSLWCSLVGGRSLLQPADPPDVRAQESDLRLRHRLHHQRHAHCGQPGAAQRHEIGTTRASHLAHSVHGFTPTLATACSPLPQPAPWAITIACTSGPGHPEATPHPLHRPCMEPWPSCGGPRGGSEDGHQPCLHPAHAPPWPVCSTKTLPAVQGLLGN